ncbi:MAG: RNA polymerase sigma factor [Methylococcales bacterium]
MNTSQSMIDTLYFEHRQTIIKVLFRMVGCYQTAEDLAQDAYLNVCSAIRKNTIAHPQPFLYQTAKNLALDHLRKEKVRGRNLVEWTDDSVTLEVASPLPTPETSAAIAEQIDRLLEILSGQPQRRREILVLHKVHGWRYDDIASHFGISRSAVEKNIRIALAHCLAARNQISAD